MGEGSALQKTEVSITIALYECWLVRDWDIRQLLHASRGSGRNFRLKLVGISSGVGKKGKGLRPPAEPPLRSYYFWDTPLKLYSFKLWHT